jgi:hypothetical protein
VLLRLLLLFTLVPLPEPSLPVRLGRQIVAAETVAVVIGTGVLGAVQSVVGSRARAAER